MLLNSSLISPLPKITVQSRSYKVNSRITEMVKKLGKRRQMEILQERSQGFWMEDQVKISLDRIKMRSHRMKTMPFVFNSHQLQPLQPDDKKHKTFNKHTFQKKKTTAKHYLPQLNQMIRARQSENDSLLKAKRRKIIQLLVLCLNRRSLGKLYQALDIVLLASYYFQKDDQQRALKSICLSLISKLHHEIKNSHLTIKRKSKLNKRRKSLTVMNYHSRQNFMENFMLKLRKTKLVGQFSYFDSKKQSLNTYKINAKCQVTVPKPQQIFGQDTKVTNYDFVAITVDDHTNMLPYQYPKSLHEKISPTQYRKMISKLNGLLFPESKCYSLSSILKLFYLPFMTIFMLFLFFTVLRSFVTDDIGRIVIICSVIVCVLILGIKVNNQESGFTNYIEIKDQMREYFNQWEKQYVDLNIKFKMGDNVDAIFIAFPADLPDSSQPSSQKLTEVEQVDQNATQGNTQSKYNKTDKGTITRRTGGRFQDNGNIMKLDRVQRHPGRQNTVNSTHLCQQSKNNQFQAERPMSQKKIQKPLQSQNIFLFDDFQSNQSNYVQDKLQNMDPNKQNQKNGNQCQQVQNKEKEKAIEIPVLKSKENTIKVPDKYTKSQYTKSKKYIPNTTKGEFYKQKKVVLLKGNGINDHDTKKQEQKQFNTQNQKQNEPNNSIPKKKQRRQSLPKNQDNSETYLVTPQANHDINSTKKQGKQSRFASNQKNTKQKSVY